MYAAKEKKKVDKHQPQPVTVLADVAKFKCKKL